MQESKIIWCKTIENLPAPRIPVLVSLITKDHKKPYMASTTAEYTDGKWCWVCAEPIAEFLTVVAWAYLPDPYKE